MLSTIQQSFPDNGPVHDLSFINFARRVLLPETAVLLAQDDLNIPRAKAVDIIRASRHFGISNHPDDDVRVPSVKRKAVKDELIDVEIARHTEGQQEVISVDSD